jgi:hypothetical protein
MFLYFFRKLLLSRIAELQLAAGLNRNEKTNIWLNCISRSLSFLLYVCVICLLILKLLKTIILYYSFYLLLLEEIITQL